MAKKDAGKTFVVIDGDLRLFVECTAKMYVVSSLDIKGLNTQGRTIEEAIDNVHDAAKLLAEYRAEELNQRVFNLTPENTGTFSLCSTSRQRQMPSCGN